MYNQVVKFNPLKPSEVIGDLAIHWEVQDGGMIYVFHLHENVQWWDGHDRTAEDVAFSIHRMLEPGKPRPRVGLLRPMTKAAETIDQHTVKVHLHYPAPSFLPFLAVDYMKVVPKHVVEARVDINVWENIIGSGLFKIKWARRGDAVTYEKNPQYFKPGRPYLDGLTIMAISDPGTAAAAIKAGKITMTTALTSLGIDDAPPLEKDLRGRYTLYWQPVNGAHISLSMLSASRGKTSGSSRPSGWRQTDTRSNRPLVAGSICSGRHSRRLRGMAALLKTSSSARATAAQKRQISRPQRRC